MQTIDDLQLLKKTDYNSNNRNREKKMRKKYVTRIFMMLTALLIMIVMVISIIGFSFIRLKITQEQIKHNQLSVNQASRNVSSYLTSCAELIDLMATDSMIIEMLKDNQIGNVEEEEMIFAVEKLLNERIATWLPNEMNLYRVSYDPSHSVDPNNSTVIGQAYLKDSEVDESQSSIYKYNFSLSQDVTDLITEKSYGHIKLMVNELVLMQYYSDLRTPQNDFYILNQKGDTISNYRKDTIGKPYFNFVEGDLNTKYLEFEENNDSFMVFHQQIPNTQWYVMSEINESLIVREVSQLKWPIVIVLAIAVVLIAGISFVFSSMIAKPIRYINGILEEVAEGNLQVRAEFEEKNEFSSIGENFNVMIAKINELLYTVKYQEKMKRLVELDFLRAQINPHFIYNTLSSIRFYVEMNKTSEAEKMLMHFSTVLRKTLSRSDEMITLKEELDIVMSYVELQKLRYKDGFEVDCHWPDDQQEIWMPAFILQPIVENAIYYNMNSNEKTLIQITAKLQNQHLLIEIWDNGIGMSDDQIEEALKQKNNINKVGIRNVDERMKLIYGNEYGLIIESQEGKGTKVCYKIPLLLEGTKQLLEEEQKGK